MRFCIFFSNDTTSNCANELLYSSCHVYLLSDNVKTCPRSSGLTSDMGYPYNLNHLGSSNYRGGEMDRLARLSVNQLGINVEFVGAIVTTFA